MTVHYQTMTMDDDGMTMNHEPSNPYHDEYVQLLKEWRPVVADGVTVSDQSYHFYTVLLRMVGDARKYRLMSKMYEEECLSLKRELSELENSATKALRYLAESLGWDPLDDQYGTSLDGGDSV